MKGPLLTASALLAASAQAEVNDAEGKFQQGLEGPAPKVLDVSGEVSALANDVVTAEVATFTQEGLDEISFEVAGDVDTLIAGISGEDFEPQCEGDPGLYGFLDMVRQAYVHLAQGTEVTEADVLAYIENDLERFTSWHESNVEDAIDFEEGYEDQITLAKMKDMFEVNDIETYLSIKESEANIAELKADIAEAEADIAEAEADIAEAEENIKESDKRIQENRSEFFATLAVASAPGVK